MFKGFKIKMPVLGRSLHSKLIFSFVTLTILLVLSTTLVFSSMYIASINNEITSETSNALDRINTEFENLFSQTRNYFRLIKENPDINAFLFFSDFDPLTINHVDQFLKQVQYTSPYFHSIFLYSQTYGEPIHSGRSDINVIQFTKDGLSHPNVKSDLNFVNSVITTDETSGIDQINSTLSIIFEGSDLNDMPKGNMVIMNLDRSEIEKKLLGKLEGITVFSDESGNVIFNPYNSVNSTTIENEPYFKKIAAGKEYKGDFRIKLNDENKLITYVKNIESGFYIINMKSISSITKPIVKARTTFILISLIIALVFCLTGYFVSNKLFLPIKKATDKLANSRFGQQLPHMTEMDMISKVFEETTEHIRELESRNENNCCIYKENIFRQLLKANISPDSAEQTLKDYRLNIELPSLIHICFKIDNYTGIAEGDRSIYEATLCKIIPEILKDDFICEAVNMFQGEIAILLNFKNSEENSFTQLVSAIDRVRSMSSQTLHITLTAGIGGLSDSMAEWPEAYRKAVEMSKHRFVLGPDRTIYKQLLDSKLNTNLSYPFEIEDKLIASIKANKRNVYINTLYDFIELLGNYHYSEVISVLFQVLTSFVKTMNPIAGQDSSKLSFNFDEINKILSELQTLEQVKLWMVSIFDEYQRIVEQINQIKNDKHYKTVEKMQEYIKKNYHNMSLSVELIADMAGYTPSYFTRIFKEISGLYVNDFIRQVRINRAKELLNLPDSKVSDIPFTVGFTNLSHFSTVFKKDVGLSPSAYRDYVLSKK